MLADNIFSDYNFVTKIHTNFDNFDKNRCQSLLELEIIKYDNLNLNDIFQYVIQHNINVILCNNLPIYKEIVDKIKEKCLVISIAEIRHFDCIKLLSEKIKSIPVSENYAIKVNTENVTCLSVTEKIENKIENIENKIENVENVSVIIYILCFNDERYNNALNIYKKYKWAFPILMKYNDFSFENSFFQQLSEIKNEWINCDMVGILSYSAFKKINISHINKVIVNKLYYPNVYYHFSNLKNKVLNGYAMSHPYFSDIWKSIIPKLNLFSSSNEARCNYWMCKPKIMTFFLDWYLNVCKPLLINEPYIFENSNYMSPNFSVDLIKLWGKPYIPNYPFVCERLHHTYFVSKHKMIFLISHEDSLTGAPIALLNMKRIYDNNNIINVILNYPELIRKKVNIVNFIIEESKKQHCSPVVIVNTLVCYPLIQIFLKTNILTYWYIHEWFEPERCHYDFNNHLKLLENSNSNNTLNLLFICNKQKEQYEKYVSSLKNNFILTNVISKKKLDEIIDEKLDFCIKNDNTLIISIIGSIALNKNQQSFIDNVFYKLLSNLEIDIKLMLVGKPFMDLVIDETYKDKIIFTGEVKNSIPYINNSDIVVSYSINEVSPLNIIESFYCKKPVVASNVGGVCEIIDNGNNGFLFDVNDSENCYKLLCDLINNQQLRKEIGDKAYNKYLDKFNADTNFEDYLFILGFN